MREKFITYCLYEPIKRRKIILKQSKETMRPSHSNHCSSKGVCVHACAILALVLLTSNKFVKYNVFLVVCLKFVLGIFSLHFREYVVLLN